LGTGVKKVSNPKVSRINESLYKGTYRTYPSQICQPNLKGRIPPSFGSRIILGPNIPIKIWVNEEGP